MRWLIFALLSVSFLPAQQLSFQGIVTDAVTHQPMAGVHVVLRAANTQSEMSLQPYGAMSRKDGTFSIGQLPPGTYALNATYNGYFLISATNGNDDTIVTLKFGEDLKDFAVRMTPHAVISGRVLDEYGDPVSRIAVVAQTAGSEGYQAMTDDRGQYRIPLTPGKYYIEALAQSFGALSMGPQEFRTDGATPRALGNTFYPSASSKENATLVELTPGQNANGIDIHLTSLVSIAIGGTVTGAPPGRPDGFPGALIVLTRIPASGSFDSFMRTAIVDPDGKFMIAGIPPGRYQIAARSMGAAALHSAPMEVTVENTSVTDLTLSLVQGETLSGRVQIEGTAAQPAAAETLTVRLQSRALFGGAAGSQVSSDGTFRIANVFPAKFSVHVAPLPENAYIKSIKLNANESPDESIDLSGGVNGAQVEIVVGRNGGQIEGSLVDSEGKPIANQPAVVLLASADSVAAGNAEPDTKEVAPGEKFRFTGLRPGKYRLMAMGPRRFPAGPDALTSLLSKAPEIEVHENDRISKDINVTVAESADAK